MTTHASPPGGSPDRYQQGVQLLTETHGPQAAQEILEAFDALYPPFGRYVLEAGFADVYARPGLTVQQRELINVAVFVTLGDSAPQLTTHITAAARNGATPVEIFETIFHVALYAGQPRAVNAFAVARTVLDLPTPSAQPDRADPREAPDDREAAGRALLEHIHGRDRAQEIVDGLSAASPDFARYVLEAGFADVYARAGLTLQQRQLLTVAALATLGGTENQLRVHIRAALNVGVATREILELMFHVAVYAGHPRAVNALAIAHEIFAEMGSTPAS